LYQNNTGHYEWADRNNNWTADDVKCEGEWETKNEVKDSSGHESMNLKNAWVLSEFLFYSFHVVSTHRIGKNTGMYAHV